jgi:hypothetical protein
MMRASCFCTVAALLLAGCSGGRSDSETRKRVADKDVNTKHLKGTTDVLKNYRYGERPEGAKPKGKTVGGPEKAK